jgi:toxin ParE1/3/4
VRQRAVVFAPEAEADLIHIYEWIAERAGSRTALRYIERIENYCSRFDLASERGTGRDDVRPGLRVIGFERRLTIAIVVDSDSVTVLRIFYGGVDWESAFS